MGARVVAEARRWLGTPYVHQASLRGAGCDCLGLVRGVWRALVGAEPEAVPPYSPDWGETGAQEPLLPAARRWLIEKPVDAAAPGDVIVFRLRRGAVAKHVGIQTEAGATPRFIHAYSGHGVVENALTPAWQRRIAARFAYPAPHDVTATAED